MRLLIAEGPCLPWQMSTKLESAVTRCEDALHAVSARRKCISKCALQWALR